MAASPFCILVCCLVFCVFGSSAESDPDEYDGYYDLSARDTGYLCSLMNKYKESGKQPDIVSDPAPSNFPKGKYLRKPKSSECWRNRWNPCSAKDLGKTKPCGWYQMEKADKSECQ